MMPLKLFQKKAFESSCIKSILTPKFALILSCAFNLIQFICLSVAIIYSIAWHFERIKGIQYQCLNYFVVQIRSPIFCFFVNLIPGLILIPALCGLVIWPLLLTCTCMNLLFRKKEWDHLPPYYCQIEKLQIKLAEWCLDHSFHEKKVELIRHILHTTSIPLEVIQLILKQVEYEQEKEKSLYKIQLTFKSKIPKFDFLLYLRRWSDILSLSSTSSYIIFIDERARHLQEEELIWYAVFFKDLAIFVLLCILQISLPYWLYHL